MPISQHHGLTGFLGISPLPPTKPWTRLFAKAGTIDGVWWRPSKTECDECESSDFTFVIHLYPLQSPFEVVLCIGCGALETRHFVQGQFVQVCGGEDWSGRDDAIDHLRRGLREREQLVVPDKGSWDF